MCSKMAEHAANQREFDQAIRLYKEALQYDPEHAPTLLALAKLYMQVSIWKEFEKSLAATESYKTSWFIPLSFH